MKLVTFESNGRSAVGLLNADATAVHPVPGCADMQTLIGLLAGAGHGCRAAQRRAAA